METNDQSYLQISFMPYAPLKQEVVIGDVHFYPVKPDKKNILNKYVRDKKVRDHIYKLFRQYKTSTGTRIENIALVAVGPLDLKELSPRQAENLEIAKLILAFLCIDNNSQFHCFTSDNFEIFRQNFTPGNLGIAPQSGVICRTTSGGMTIKDFVFVKPEWVNIPWAAEFKSDLLQALLACLTNKDTDIECSQILRSLEWFYGAYKNSQDVSEFSRVVLMAMAFETLLDFRDRQDFRNKIQQWLGNSSEPTSPVTVQLRNGTIIENLTEKQAWANSFYELRNDIVHGKKIPFSDLSYGDKGHFYIAERFYRECIKRILTSKRLYGFDLEGEFFPPVFSTTPQELDGYLLNQEVNQ